MALFFAAWLALRARRPDAPRPFRVPVDGVRAGLCLVALPISVTLFTLAVNLQKPRGALQFAVAVGAGLGRSTS